MAGNLVFGTDRVEVRHRVGHKSDGKVEACDGLEDVDVGAGWGDEGGVDAEEITRVEGEEKAGCELATIW